MKVRKQNQTSRHWHEPTTGSTGITGKDNKHKHPRDPRDPRGWFVRPNRIGFDLEILGSLLLVVLLTANAFAQRATGAITGRVVGDDGQPVRHATISISSLGGGGRSAGRLTVVSDEAGNLQAEGLDSVPYTLSATEPGYVLEPKLRRET